MTLDSARVDAEIYLPPGTNGTGRVILGAIADVAAAAGVSARVTDRYRGTQQWLVMWGVGADDRSAIRDRHIAAGGTVVLWDIGFFNRTKFDGHCKASINHDYATKWLDRTEPCDTRWSALGIELRDDADPKGHIVLAGIGPKQHAYIGKPIANWEAQKLAELRRRFPGRRIVYRPKPKREYVKLHCETDAKSEIHDLLRGAALVVCHHSNVAVDAVLAGVPFESDDGVSTWLRGKPYTREVRADFCRRIARWQYKRGEMVEAWHFLRGVVNGTTNVL